jgi:hypothetical protein
MRRAARFASALVLAAALVTSATSAQASALTTTRVSLSTAATQTGKDVAVGANGLSEDGRYVLMTSAAGDLVAGDTNRSKDVFVRDVVSATMERDSVSSTGHQANNSSTANAITSDGRFVLFTSWATNLASRRDVNGVSDVFIRDRTLGITRRVSIPPSGGRQFGSPSYGVAVSADGRFVLFVVQSLPDRRTYVRDRLTGVTYRIGTHWRHWDVIGLGMSANGRMVAFSRTHELHTGDNVMMFRDRATNRNIVVLGQSDIRPSCCSGPVFFTPDGTAALVGAMPSTGGISTVVVWKQGESETTLTQLPTLHDDAYPVGISDDGSEVAFTSDDPALVPGDTNQATDVFTESVSTGTVERVDLTAAGGQIPEGTTDSGHAAFSGDGHWAAFDSRDTTIVAGDTNGRADVFLRGSLP